MKKVLIFIAVLLMNLLNSNNVFAQGSSRIYSFVYERVDKNLKDKLGEDYENMTTSDGISYEYSVSNINRLLTDALQCCVDGSHENEQISQKLTPANLNYYILRELTRNVEVDTRLYPSYKDFPENDCFSFDKIKTTVREIYEYLLRRGVLCEQNDLLNNLEDVKKWYELCGLEQVLLEFYDNVDDFQDEIVYSILSADYRKFGYYLDESDNLFYNGKKEKSPDKKDILAMKVQAMLIDGFENIKQDKRKYARDGKSLDEIKQLVTQQTKALKKKALGISNGESYVRQINQYEDTYTFESAINGVYIRAFTDYEKNYFEIDYLVINYLVINNEFDTNEVLKRKMDLLIRKGNVVKQLANNIITNFELKDAFFNIKSTVFSLFFAIYEVLDNGSIYNKCFDAVDHLEYLQIIDIARDMSRIAIYENAADYLELQNLDTKLLLGARLLLSNSFYVPKIFCKVIEENPYTWIEDILCMKLRLTCMGSTSDDEEEESVYEKHKL